MKIKNVIIFDGSQASKKDTWDKDFIMSLQNTIKESLIYRYGQYCIDENFQLIVFTLENSNEDDITQIKLDKNGKQNCNWLTSILEKKYNKFPTENIIDENGIFMDDTIVFCDYWWRGLDKKVLKKNTETKTDLDPAGQINSSIIDEVFELAANNKDVIFIPYDLYVFENSVEYGTERENEDSTACRLVYPFTFSGDKVTTLYSFEDLILDDFSDDLLLAKDNNNKKVKKLVNKKNRMDKGSHVTYIY